MATNSFIGLKTLEGFEYIYCHFDGGSLKRTLLEHYSSPEFAQALISKGDLRAVMPNLDDTYKEAFDTPDTRQFTGNYAGFARNTKANYPNISYIYIFDEEWKIVKLGDEQLDWHPLKYELCELMEDSYQEINSERIPFQTGGGLIFVGDLGKFLARLPNVKLPPYSGVRSFQYRAADNAVVDCLELNLGGEDYSDIQVRHERACSTFYTFNGSIGLMNAEYDHYNNPYSITSSMEGCFIYLPRNETVYVRSCGRKIQIENSQGKLLVELEI